jgi:hypothetical protein
MAYLKTREVAAVAMGAALWGVLNSILSPIVFNLTGLPILCDILGFTVLTLAAWWIRKLGALTAIGLIATAINFAINPQAIIFLGFTAASIVFDISMSAAKPMKPFSKPTKTVFVSILFSMLSAAVAGALIGAFFMASSALVVWGGVAGWALLHAVGGLGGGVLGGIIVNMLILRKVTNRSWSS